MARSGLFNLRSLDDILVLALTRWRPRNTVKAVNAVCSSQRMKKHQEATAVFCWKQTNL
jgi:hypothetical protein